MPQSHKSNIEYIVLLSPMSTVLLDATVSIMRLNYIILSLSRKQRMSLSFLLPLVSLFIIINFSITVWNFCYYSLFWGFFCMIICHLFSLYSLVSWNPKKYDFNFRLMQSKDTFRYFICLICCLSTLTSLVGKLGEHENPWNFSCVFSILTIVNSFMLPTFQLCKLVWSLHIFLVEVCWRKTLWPICGNWSERTFNSS